MKIFNDSYSEYSKNEITEFVKKSIPEKKSNLTFENFKTGAGWYIFILKIHIKIFK